MREATLRRAGLLLAAAGLLVAALPLLPGAAASLARVLSLSGHPNEKTVSLTRLALGGGGMLMGLFGLALRAGAEALLRFAGALRAEQAASRRSRRERPRTPELRVEWRLLVMICMCGALARAAWMNAPIRMDEAISYLDFARQGALFSLTHYHTNSHTLNTLLMWMCSRLFGDAEWALRLPAFLAGIACIPLVFVFFRRVAGAPAALLAAAATAALPGMVEFGFLARGYSLQTAMFFGLLLSVQTLGRRHSAWSLLGVVILPALMMYTLLPSLYAVATAALWGLAATRAGRGRAAARTLLLAFTLSVGLTLLLFAPLVLVSGLSSITHNYYVRPLPLSEVASLFPESLFWTWAGWHRGLSLSATLLSLPFFVIGAAKLRGRSPAWAAAVCVPVLVLLQRVVPYPRIWLFLLPVFMGTAAYGFARAVAGLNAGRRLVLMTAACIAVAGCAWNAVNPAIENSRECSGWPDDRAVARELVARGIAPPDRLVANTVYARLNYYLHRARVPHEVVDAAAGNDTRRVFIVRAPEGVEWRLKMGLRGCEGTLGPERLLATFRNGTTLSLARREPGSDPASP